MRSRLNRFRRLVLAAGGLLLSALPPVGAAEPASCPGACGAACSVPSCRQSLCGWFHDPCATIPAGAIPAPAGSAVRSWDALMADKAADDQFVVYQHEWYMGSGLLGPYGCSHVKRIAALLPRQPSMVVLQPAPSPELNESRRMLLIRLLQREGVEDAEHRVIVSFPPAEGMAGDEAARAYDRGHGAPPCGGCRGY